MRRILVVLAVLFLASASSATPMVTTNRTSVVAPSTAFSDAVRENPARGANLLESNAGFADSQRDAFEIPTFGSAIGRRALFPSNFTNDVRPTVRDVVASKDSPLQETMRRSTSFPDVR